MKVKRQVSTDIVGVGLSLLKSYNNYHIPLFINKTIYLKGDLSFIDVI